MKNTKGLGLRYVVVLLAIGLLTACSDNSDSREETLGNTQQQESPQGVIPAHQLQVLEKAKQVEAMMQESADKVDRSTDY